MPDINRAYTWSIQTCNAPNVGYSQTYRNQKTVNGITYYDCSSFINYALLAGGFTTPNYASSHNAFTTGSMANVLLSLGFTEVSATGEYLPGDVGLSSGHTEMCYQGGTGKGIFMGAHTANAKLENQVSIGNSVGDATATRSFPRIFRYGSGGASGAGRSIYVVSALCGNAWRESTINPGIDVGQGGWGLWMWTGERKDALLAWLSDNGYSKDSGIGQCAYLNQSNLWVGSYAGYDSLQGFLSSTSTDIQELTEAFLYCFERPGSPDPERRTEYAMTCYEYIRQHAQDSTITDWTIEDGYLPENKLLNNAVMMYRFFSAGGGGGGSPTDPKKKMAVWMMIRYNY